MAHNAASSSSPFTTNFYEPTSSRSPYRAHLQSSSAADGDKSINAHTRSSPQAAIAHGNIEYPFSSSTSLPRLHVYDDKGPRDMSKTVPVREELDRCRTVSAGSSREGHGRKAVTRNPETPGGGALERSISRASPHAPSLPTQFAAGSIHTQSKTWASSSLTSSTRPTHLVSPAIDSPLSASRQTCADLVRSF